LLILKASLGSGSEHTIRNVSRAVFASKRIASNSFLPVVASPATRLMVLIPCSKAF